MTNKLPVIEQEKHNPIRKGIESGHFNLKDAIEILDIRQAQTSRYVAELQRKEEAKWVCDCDYGKLNSVAKEPCSKCKEEFSRLRRMTNKLPVIDQKATWFVSYHLRDGTFSGYGNEYISSSKNKLRAIDLKNMKKFIEDKLIDRSKGRSLPEVIILNFIKIENDK